MEDNSDSEPEQVVDVPVKQKKPRSAKQLQALEMARARALEIRKQKAEENQLNKAQAKIESKETQIEKEKEILKEKQASRGETKEVVSPPPPPPPPKQVTVEPKYSIKKDIVKDFSKKVYHNIHNNAIVKMMAIHPIHKVPVFKGISIQ